MNIVYNNNMGSKYKNGFAFKYPIFKFSKRFNIRQFFSKIGGSDYLVEPF